MMSFVSHSHFLIYCILFFILIVNQRHLFLMILNNVKENKDIICMFANIAGIVFHMTVATVIYAIILLILKNNARLLQYVQIIGLSYLLCFGIQTMTMNMVQNNAMCPSVSRNRAEAFVSGFLHCISDMKYNFALFSLISQFIQYDGSCLFVLINVMICLILFRLLVFVGLRFNFLDCYNKFFSSIVKTMGFIVILLVITNIKSILR